MTHTQTQGADGAGTKTAGEDSWTFDRTRAYLLAELERLKADLNTVGEDLTGDQGKAVSWLDVALGRVANVASVLSTVSGPAPTATPGVPDSLWEAFAAATDSPVFVHDFADPAVSSAPGCQDVSLSFVTPDHITAAFMGNGLAGTIDQARKDAVALAAAWNHVRALIAAQPAGQAGDAGEDARTVLTEACKPWEHYTGEPPDDGSPLSGVFVAGMVYTERLLAKLLDVTHYEGGDGSEDFDNDATQTLRNILTGAGLWDADENRATNPAPDSTRTGAAETAELREEVAYWRRDLSARLCSLTALYKAALDRGESDRAADLANAIRPALASYHNAEDGEWHERCELCGEFVRDGEPRAAWEDVSGHARCLSEDGKGHVDPHGDEDLARQVEAAQAALDAPWPEAALAARPEAPEAQGADDLAARLRREIGEVRTMAADPENRESACQLTVVADNLEALLAARPEAPSDAGWSFDMEAAPRDGSDVEIVNDRGQFIAQFDATWADGGWWMVSDGKDPERPLRGNEPFAWRLPTTPPSDPAPSGQAEG